MAAVLQGVMGDAGARWFLFAVGADLAVAAEMCGISGPAFAPGMYLPMEPSSQLVVGALVSWRSARGSWLGLAVFLSLAAFVSFGSKRETVESWTPSGAFSGRGRSASRSGSPSPRGRSAIRFRRGRGRGPGPRGPHGEWP